MGINLFNKVAIFVSFREGNGTPSSTLAGKSHGRSLEGCSPWGLWGSDVTEQLHFHFSLSCIGEGNGNPLQCSCLENPRDGGALWAAVYGIAQSRTRLRRLSSSSRMKPWSLQCWPQVCKVLPIAWAGHRNKLLILTARM